jgi:hypothetical protein
MSMPSNSSLSDELGINIAETKTWEMNHLGTMDYSDGGYSVVFSISKSTSIELEDTFERYNPGRIRAAWGWTLNNQKVEPTLLVATGLPERAVAILLRWPSALQSKGADRTTFDNLTKVIFRDNLLIQMPDLGIPDFGTNDDVFGFPGVIVMEPSTKQGFNFKSMMTHRRHLQAPIEFLSSGKIPQDKTFDFPIFDGSFFPTQSEVLGGGFIQQ